MELEYEIDYVTIVNVKIPIKDIFYKFDCNDILEAMVSAKKYDFLGIKENIYDSEDIKKWAMKKFNLVEESE